ncbi:MAG: TRAP transporter large permease [Proteobacteria bacterium]|nr:TRAP transporter large permease [Pseudomonadota bacterium]
MMSAWYPVLGLLLLLLAGLPIAFALPLVGLAMLYTVFGPTAVFSVPQTMFGALDSFTLLSIPFFILAADILIAAGIARHMVIAVEKLIGHYRGGLATVAVVACAFFASISGSSAATAIAVGSVLLPEMVRQGYDPKYSAGLIAVAGGLGILIPPSIPMIVYGSVAEQSVGKLFIAGLTPGILYTIALVLAAIIVLGRGHKTVEAASWDERREALRKSVWVLFLPIIIAGLIYGGIATPTETAGVAVIYALFLAVVVYRGLRPRQVLDVLAKSAGSSAMIMMIIAGAHVFSYGLTILRIPQGITENILTGVTSQILFLFLVNIVLLVMGMFLDIISILLITSPIFIPILVHLGIDPIYFAVIFVINMELALITPPLGLHLFIMSGISRLPISRVLQGVLPFAFVGLVILAVVVMFPVLSLWLVR